MKKAYLFFAPFIFFMSAMGQTNQKDSTPATPPDTVSIGLYITSIHNIDFKQKEYDANFWLWLRYKNRAFNFAQNLEIPQAKSFTTSYSTIDSSGEQVYMLMKIEANMKDSWRISNFPFDHQKLRISVENSQFDSKSLVFKPDTLGNNFDPRFTINGWVIDSCILSVSKKAYETSFGDVSLPKPHVEYSAFRVRMDLDRNATGLFWKMFLGMYIAFLIAYVCFYIHADGIDSRFGLSVGSLFAVIGNKYIIDSSLPESTTFTLVDTLHGITLFFIFAVITATAWSLKLVKQNKIKQARRFDMLAAQIFLFLYVSLNIFFIWQAHKSG
ncbi:MAG: hypothetical protein WCH29_05430 [Chitinophagaceae bacterium]